MTSNTVFTTSTTLLAIQDFASTYTVTATQTKTMQLVANPAGTGRVQFFPLTTTIPIRDFPTNAPSPFVPAYTSFDDGSLLTALFINDFAANKENLVALGFLMSLFAHNSLLSLSYIWRVKLKNKTLFHFLLCSQLCGVLCAVSLLVPYFIRRARCDMSDIIATVFIEASITFLIPGILGVKAYRFLRRSRFVLFTIPLLHFAALALSFSDLAKVSSRRNLTGSCTTHGNFPRATIAIILITAENIFICLCFVYAVWRSSRYPEARGRLSIRLSIERALSQAESAEVTSEKNDISLAKAKDSVQYGGPNRLQAAIMTLFGDRDLIDVPWPKTPPNSSSKQSSQNFQNLQDTRSQAEKRTSWRSLSKMFKIPIAMKNELVYTLAVSVTCALSAVVIVIGAMNNNFLGGIFMFVGLGWAVISLLILHNFSRLVRRNERERILQEPAAWKPLLRPHSEWTRSAESLIQRPSRQRPNSVGVFKPSRVLMNPFDDFEPVERRGRASEISWRTQRASKPYTDRRPLSGSSYSSHSSFSQLLPASIEVERDSYALGEQGAGSKKFLRSRGTNSGKRGNL